jgi:hypothetical protein
MSVTITTPRRRRPGTRLSRPRAVMASAKFGTITVRGTIRPSFCGRSARVGWECWCEQCRRKLTLSSQQLRAGQAPCGCFHGIGQLSRGDVGSAKGRGSTNFMRVVSFGADALAPSQRILSAKGNGNSAPPAKPPANA